MVTEISNVLLIQMLLTAYGKHLFVPYADYIKSQVLKHNFKVYSEDKPIAVFSININNRDSVIYIDDLIIIPHYLNKNKLPNIFKAIYEEYASLIYTLKFKLVIRCYQIPTWEEELLSISTRQKILNKNHNTQFHYQVDLDCLI